MLPPVKAVGAHKYILDYYVPSDTKGVTVPPPIVGGGALVADGFRQRLLCFIGVVR